MEGAPRFRDAPPTLSRLLTSTSTNSNIRSCARRGGFSFAWPGGWGSLRLAPMLAPIWHNPTVLYHTGITGPDFVFRSSVVSFRIRLKLAIRICSARPSLSRRSRGTRIPYDSVLVCDVTVTRSPSGLHTCAGVNSSVAVAVPAVV